MRSRGCTFSLEEAKIQSKGTDVPWVLLNAAVRRSTRGMTCSKEETVGSRREADPISPALVDRSECGAYMTRKGRDHSDLIGRIVYIRRWGRDFLEVSTPLTLSMGIEVTLGS